MSIQTLSSKDLHATIVELGRCLYNHELWLDGLFGTLICGLQPDERDLGPDAHLKCRLGQWYYSQNEIVAGLASQPGFVGLGAEHERMHAHAATMLRRSDAGEEVPLQEFQRFIAAMKSMRLEITTLMQILEEALHTVDPLTGASGRVGMLSTLHEQQALVERGAQSCCIAMMDLDHFKSVNDTYGHPAGDEVLVSFTRYAMQTLRPYDRVFRYGGEEFIIVMPDTSGEEGLNVIERLRNGLAALPQMLRPKDPVFVTASFGLVHLEPRVPVETSIARADKALYAAKAAGRNHCVVWSASIDGDSALWTQSAA